MLRFGPWWYPLRADVTERVPVVAVRQSIKDVKWKNMGVELLDGSNFYPSDTFACLFRVLRHCF